MQDGKLIILFDGVCNLCNGAVQFVIRRDRHNHFMFASLQSVAGQAYLKQFELNTQKFDSFVLLEGEKIYFKSTATLKVAKYLAGPWRILSIFLIVPRFLRDAVYDLVSRNRYLWFGKRDSCMIPTPELKAKFISE